MNGAGLCIGVSRYSDGRLTSCPSAARTANELAAALGPSLSNGVTALTNPTQSYELFMAIQTTIQKARGGLFFLYFAGVTVRKGDDLLLTTSESTLEARSNSVPWSDIDSILEQEKVDLGLVIMNAEGFAGIGWLGSSRPRMHGMGSVRVHDPITAESRIAAYGDALLDLLRGPPHGVRAHLSDGLLDVPALARCLSARFPKPQRGDDERPKRGEPPAHETYGAAEVPQGFVLRDAREDLARPAPPRLSPSSSVVASGGDAALASSGLRRLWPIALLVVLAGVAAIVWAVTR